MELQGHAVCKDCGNGTLNNVLNPQFEFDSDFEQVACLHCGSNHVDGELYLALAKRQGRPRPSFEFPA
jgi:hypothetical protein